MRPQTVLKIDPLGKSAEQIYALRDKWIAEYESYVNENPEKCELAAVLTDRVRRAADMLVAGYVSPTVSVTEDGENGDAPEYAAEDPSLDGDFPLGNSYDAEFAVPYFQVEDLVRIQFGETYSVHTGHFVEPAYDVLVRKGFILELEGEWAQAEACYNGGAMSKSVLSRADDCRKKKIAAGEAAYAEAQQYMESGEWSRVYTPLQRAVDMENVDATADMGLALIYGTFNIPTDHADGLRHLRMAAMYGSTRASMELVELHDNGCTDVDGEEAERLCKASAEAGDKKAIARLEDGFDTRPLTEILSEQAEKGNIDALWHLSVEYSRLKDYERSAEYLCAALDADQTDALLYAAKASSDPSMAQLYDPVKAEQYYMRAAEKGSEKAMIALGKMALKDTDTPFWFSAVDSTGIGDEIRKQHLAQFKWHSRAAELGCVEAMTHLVIAYHYGYPCEKDDASAFMWASRAADEGDLYAAYQVGYFYENGFGCERDDATAVLFYTQAAEGGNFDAMLRLSVIYGEGRDGVEKNPEKANRYRFMSGIGRD